MILLKKSQRNHQCKGTSLKNSIYYYKNGTLIAEKNSLLWLQRFLSSSRIGFVINVLLANKYSAKFLGVFYSAPFTKKLIPAFIKEHEIDLEHFIVPENGYKSFNDFFIRQIKKSKRPLAETSWISPADSKIYIHHNVNPASRFFVKSAPFLLKKFLGPTISAPYQNADIAIFRLAPYDYHRFHFPVDCIPKQPIVLNGWLGTVNPVSFLSGLMPLTKNKRIIIPLEYSSGGIGYLVAVGAMFVGSIKTTYTPGKPYKKGDEAGFFEFGGSTVVLITAPGTIAFKDEFKAHSKENFETAVLIGESLSDS